MIVRALIVMLVALNAGAIAWALWGADRGPAPSMPQASAVPSLQLATTQQAKPASVAPSVPGVTPAPLPAVIPTAPTATDQLASPPAQAARCLRLGPFADAAALAAARAAVQPVAAQVAVFERVRAARGWRVMLPSQGDRAAAQAVVERIRAAGIEDYYIVGEGVEANSIALGRYGNEQAARSREASLRAAGFPARAEPLGQGTPQQWLDVRLPSQAAPAGIGGAVIDCAAFGNPAPAG